MLTNIQRISTETQTDFETSLKNDKIDIKEKIKLFFRKLTTIIIKNSNVNLDNHCSSNWHWFRIFIETNEFIC